MPRDAARAESPAFWAGSTSSALAYCAKPILSAGALMQSARVLRMLAALNQKSHPKLLDGKRWPLSVQVLRA